MTLDTRTPAEIAYDAERNGTLYFPKADEAPENTDLLIEILERIEGHFDRKRLGVMIEIQQELEAGDEDTADIVSALFEAGEMPSSDQVYDLIKEDRIAHFMWWRAVDWVLWRQRQGLPVERMSTEDDFPAGINARFDAAAAAYHTIGQWPEPIDVHELCNADVIRGWERRK